MRIYFITYLNSMQILKLKYIFKNCKITFFLIIKLYYEKIIVRKLNLNKNHPKLKFWKLNLVKCILSEIAGSAKFAIFTLPIKFGGSATKELKRNYNTAKTWLKYLISNCFLNIQKINVLLEVSIFHIKPFNGIENIATKSFQRFCSLKYFLA